MTRVDDSQEEGRSPSPPASPLPKTRISGKWVFYAILLFALLHMIFFFAQTFFGS